MMPPSIKVALAGNPNSGKTTLFNALTGSHYKVGNYPGVTVEKREGHRSWKGRDFLLCDLPGTYSLTAYSIDEVVARDYLLDEEPEVIASVMDSTSLERQLYLCLQLRELGLPMVGVLNMSDEAEAQGLSLDAAGLEASFGFPFVKTVGSRSRGIEELLGALASAKERTRPEGSRLAYSPLLEEELGLVETGLGQVQGLAPGLPARWLAVKLLEKDGDAARRLEGLAGGARVLAIAADAIADIEARAGKDAELLISEERYALIKAGLEKAGALAPGRAPGRMAAGRPTPGQALDSILMHRFLGLPAFLLIMWAMFQLTFTLGAWPQAWLEGLFSWLGGAAGALIPRGFLNLLVVNGIIGGVGAVFSFVPLIIILFFFLAILEDLGYMARAAWLTDKVLSGFGLHGQSFLPMMLGFGCSVPAIMGARTLKSRRDRIATIMAIPFMSCGAKLPVYVLLAGAFFPRHPGRIVMLIYVTGIVLALLSALLFKRTVLRGDPTPFVLELPPWRVPTARSVAWHVREKTAQYAKKMGTVILAMSVIVWFITTFPLLPASTGPAGPEAAEAALSHSIAGRLGHALEPVLRPLGFNWKIAVATVTGFAAKEVVVSTLGIFYPPRPEGSGLGGGLEGALTASPDFSPLVALVLILTTLVFPPCVAALASIKGELGWKWLGIVVAWQLFLGWGLGTLVYQGGRLLGLGLA
jgi:ferrous iron transport protein B